MCKSVIQSGQWTISLRQSYNCIEFNSKVPQCNQIHIMLRVLWLYKTWIKKTTWRFLLVKWTRWDHTGLVCTLDKSRITSILDWATGVREGGGKVVVKSKYNTFSFSSPLMVAMMGASVWGWITVYDRKLATLCFHTSKHLHFEYISFGTLPIRWKKIASWKMWQFYCLMQRYAVFFCQWQSHRIK